MSSPAQPKLIIFTDLDGTLLDHHTYQWDAAKPVLDHLKNRGAMIVLASSKTAAEIKDLQRQMDLDTHPAIIENGAGVIGLEHSAFGNKDYLAIRKALDQIAPTLRKSFVGFGDMTAATVAEVTGLSLTAADLAKERCFSEPGIWKGNESERSRFNSALNELGLSVQHGGRFMTLSKGRTKLDGLKQIAKQFRPKHTIALGDAPNDIEMLEAAEYGAIITNPHKAPLRTLNGEGTGRIIRSELPGPDGWAQSVSQLLTELSIE